MKLLIQYIIVCITVFERYIFISICGTCVCLCFIVSSFLTLIINNLGEIVVKDFNSDIYGFSGEKIVFK